MPGPNPEFHALEDNPYVEENNETIRQEKIERLKEELAQLEQAIAHLKARYPDGEEMPEEEKRAYTRIGYEISVIQNKLLTLRTHQVDARGKLA